MSLFRDMETKGEQESAQLAGSTIEESNDTTPNLNIYATVKQHIINGTGSSTFLHALLDLKADLPRTNFFPAANQKTRCKSLY